MVTQQVGASWESPAWAGSLHVSLLEPDFQHQQVVASKSRVQMRVGCVSHFSKDSHLPNISKGMCWQDCCKDQQEQPWEGETRRESWRRGRGEEGSPWLTCWLPHLSIYPRGSWVQLDTSHPENPTDPPGTAFHRHAINR